MNRKNYFPPEAVTENAAFLGLILIVGTTFVVTDSLPDETRTIAGKRYWFAGALLFAFVCLLPVIRRIGSSFRPALTDIAVVLFAVYYLTFAFFVSPVSAGRFRLGIALLVAWFYFRLFTIAYGPRKLIFLLLAAGGAEAVWGIGQYFDWLPSYHSRYDISGSFFNPGPYGGFLAIVFPLALAAAFRNRKAAESLWDTEKNTTTPKAWKNAAAGLAAYLTVGMLVMAMVMSESRTAWIAAAAGAVPVVWRHTRPAGTIRRFIATKPAKALGLGLLLLCLGGTAATGLYRMKKDSAQGRLLLWKIAYRTLAGDAAVGTGGFPAAYGKTQAAYFSSEEATPAEKKLAGCPEYAFNEYLQTGIELGATGLLLFLSVFLSALPACLRHRNGTGGALLAFLIFATASYPLSVLPTCILAVALPAAAAGKGSIRLPSPFLWGFSGLCGLFFFTWLPELYGQYKAEKKWDGIRGRYETGYYDRVDDYRCLYPRLKENTAFLFEYGYALLQNKRYKESTCILEQGARLSCDPMFYNIIGKNYQYRQATDRAAACYEYAAALVPNRAYPLYLLTLLHREAGDRETALRYGRLLLDLQPKVNSPAVKEMKSEIRKWIDPIHQRTGNRGAGTSAAGFTQE